MNRGVGPCWASTMLVKQTYTKNEAGQFVCGECGVTKVRQNTMSYHMKTHTGERTHACAHCPKAFIQKSGLTQHMAQAHPKEGSVVWACPCCDHKARMKPNLLIHIGRVHGSAWIPAVAISETGACECTGCKREFAGTTAYYYHAIQCFTPPTELAGKLANLTSHECKT